MRPLHVVFLMLFSLTLSSCDFSELFIDEDGRTISIGNLDQANAVVGTRDGGYVLVGKVGINGVSDSLSNDRSEDAVLIKGKSNGKVEWDKTFTLGYHEEAFDVIETEDDGLVMVGTVDRWSFGREGGEEGDVFLVKTDASGNEQWRRTFDSGEYDKGYGVIQDSEDNLVVVGEAGKHLLLVKYDPNGVLQWQSIIADSLDSAGFDIKDAGDGYIITGRLGEETGQRSERYILLTRVDENGQKMWSRSFENGAFYAGSSVFVKDEGFVLAGNISRYRPGQEYDNFFGVLIQTDTEGEELWRKELPNRDFDAVIQSRGGGYWAAGEWNTEGNTFVDAQLIKLDESGEEVSRDSYNKNRYDYGNDVAELAGGKVIMVGHTRRDGTRNLRTDIYVLVK